MITFFWQLSGDRKFFAEDAGMARLMKVLREAIEEEARQTPDGFTPSGNFSIYWSEVQPSQKEVA